MSEKYSITDSKQTYFGFRVDAQTEDPLRPDSPCLSRLSAWSCHVWDLPCWLLAPYQATSCIFHRFRTNNFTICMEIQKTLNSQSNLEKEEWNWRNQPAWLHALLQSHSHKDSMVLAQRQKYRSTEQNRKPRDKSTHIWTPYLRQRRQEYTME